MTSGQRGVPPKDENTRQQVALFPYGLIADLLHRRESERGSMPSCARRQSESTRYPARAALGWRSTPSATGWPLSARRIRSATYSIALLDDATRVVPFAAFPGAPHRVSRRSRSRSGGPRREKAGPNAVARRASHRPGLEDQIMKVTFASFLDSRILNGAKVRVVERGSGTNLPLEHRPSIIVQRWGGQKFERHLAVAPRVPSMEQPAV